MEVLVFAVPLSTLQRPTSRASARPSLSARRYGPAFDEYDIDGGLLRSEVESSLSSAFLPNAGIYASAASPSQKSLSAKIEAKVCHDLLDTQVHDRHRVAHLSLNRLPGAGAWLFALPDSVESHIPSPLFKVSILRRLRCLFGPRIQIALFADRSWTSGVIMHLCVAAGGIGWFGTI